MLCRGPAARPGCPPWVSPLGVSRDALRACSKVNESECTVGQALSFCFDRQLCRRADALICRRCLRGKWVRGERGKGGGGLGGGVEPDRRCLYPAHTPTLVRFAAQALKGRRRPRFLLERSDAATSFESAHERASPPLRPLRPPRGPAATRTSPCCASLIPATG